MDPDTPLPRRRASDMPDEPHISEQGLDVAKDIKRTLRRLIAFTVVLYLVLAVFIVITRIDANKSKHALCALRGNVATRIKQSVDFIAHHPEGFAGITVQEIQHSIDTDTKTFNALSGLNCD